MFRGPGGGIGDRDRRFFDPKFYRIILFDQRGAGKSTPLFTLEENDTWSLVEDIEKLRTHLGVNKWLVFGGSWGSALSLAYAQTHPTRVVGLVLRGIYMVRKEEIDWCYQSGTSFIYPDQWEKYLAPIPINERHDLVTAYHKRLIGDDEDEKVKCAKAWSVWQCAAARLFIDQEYIDNANETKWALAFARIECHYFVNQGFFTPNQLLDGAKILHKNNIPVTIVQGRYDVVCPMKSAWELHNALPDSEFHVIQDAGHSAKELGISNKLVEVTDKYKSLNYD